MNLKQLAKKCEFDFQDGAELDRDEQDKWQREARDYRCTLKYQEREYSFDYWQGIGITDGPNAEGCLDSLLSDAQAGEMDFEEFCRDFGYNEDSRKAEKTWKQCQSVNENVQELLGEDYETFLYSERD